jgi:ERCC4-related helicase
VPPLKSIPKFKLKNKKEIKEKTHKENEKNVVIFLNFRNSIFVSFLTNFKVFILFSY